MAYMDGRKLAKHSDDYVFICSYEGVKSLKWAVAITLTQLDADLREAERVENPAGIARTKNLITAYKQIYEQLAEILKS